MAQSRVRLLLLILAVVAIASLGYAVSVGHQKRQIAASYTQAQQMVKELEQERSHLSGELSQAQQTIEGQTGNMAHLQTELQAVQERLQTTMTEIAALQHEHEHLRQENTSLSTQLSSVMTEKQQLEAKLSSLKELRLAMRDVKRKMWNESWAAWRARAQAMKEADQQRLAKGNRGYVVRQGASTLGASTRLHVHVLEPQPQ